jgi:hypothetical protein
MGVVILLLLAILITLLHAWDGAGTVAAVAAYVLAVTAVVLSPVVLWVYLSAWHITRRKAEEARASQPAPGAQEG